MIDFFLSYGTDPCWIYCQWHHDNDLCFLVVPLLTSYLYGFLGYDDIDGVANFNREAVFLNALTIIAMPNNSQGLTILMQVSSRSVFTSFWLRVCRCDLFTFVEIQNLIDVSSVKKYKSNLTRFCPFSLLRNMWFNCKEVKYTAGVRTGIYLDE